MPWRLDSITNSILVIIIHKSSKERTVLNRIIEFTYAGTTRAILMMNNAYTVSKQARLFMSSRQNGEGAKKKKKEKRR